MGDVQQDRRGTRKELEPRPRPSLLHPAPRRVRGNVEGAETLQRRERDGGVRALPRARHPGLNPLELEPTAAVVERPVAVHRKINIVAHERHGRADAACDLAEHAGRGFLL
jgi:hypothetical protein